ncbi:hypothetical protein Q1695_011449 [Nippostrongylus brasiliensis]|nr:hypothetical protein Q1695_011449 [Nippostrongylus brasiliensis]
MRTTQLLLLVLFFSFATALKRNQRISSKVLLEHILHKPSDSLSWLSQLCDDFGPRMTGSPNLDKATDWIMKSLRSSGFEVHSEPVPGIPNWVRGNDSAYILEPRFHKLNILAAGGSPSGYVEGEVVVIRKIKELETADMKGKIVVTAQKWQGYDETNKFRRIANQVAKQGALALITKSVTPDSLYTPHTGWGGGVGTAPPIPAACVTPEEADMISRWAERGRRVVVRLNITSHLLPDPVLGRNVVFEIPGSVSPDQIVILSAHIDSWDVGQGAMDDGGGLAAVRSAMIAIKQLAKVNPAFLPRRTIRAIYWTAEEQGYYGSRSYFKEHSNDNIVFAAESDEGAFRPLNYRSALKYHGDRRHKAMIEDLVIFLNTNRIPLRVINSSADDQIDLEPFAKAGIPVANYLPDRAKDHYFKYHHTNADYVTVFKEDDLKTTAAIFSTLVYYVANEERW